MHSHFGRLTLVCLLFIVAILACNLPSGTPTPDIAASQVAATLTALETTASAPQPALTETPVPSNTNPPLSTPTPGNPVVIHDSLCSEGPGSVYDVVSSVKTGTRVQLIGVGSISGWYIITNPIYHDPCWIAAANLQIDPFFNLSGLQVYTPPPPPTSTPSDTPEPTDTPVPTSAT